MYVANNYKHGCARNKLGDRCTKRAKQLDLLCRQAKANGEQLLGLPSQAGKPSEPGSLSIVQLAS